MGSPKPLRKTEQNLENLRVQEIVKGLWLGPKMLIPHEQVEHNHPAFDAVVNVTKEEPIQQYGSVLLGPNVRHLQIPVDDTMEEANELYPYFVTAVGFILVALSCGETVLVHCKAGISRSVTIVAAYLIYALKKTKSEAMDMIREKRPCADPHLGYLCQLDIFEKVCQMLAYKVIQFPSADIIGDYFPVQPHGRIEDIRVTRLLLKEGKTVLHHTIFFRTVFQHEEEAKEPWKYYRELCNMCEGKAYILEKPLNHATHGCLFHVFWRTDVIALNTSKFMPYWHYLTN
jgi:protein-tyrosine phosphatase